MLLIVLCWANYMVPDSQGNVKEGGLLEVYCERKFVYLGTYFF